MGADGDVVGSASRSEAIPTYPASSLPIFHKFKHQPASCTPNSNSVTAYQRAQTDADAKSHTVYACRSATLWGETEFLLSPRFLKKDVGRPALCWTHCGTTSPESGRWGPRYHLIEAFCSETVGCENFRGLCTNRENEPQRSKGSNREKALGDIVPPPRSFPLPPSCPFSPSSGCWCGYHQLCPLLLSGYPCPHWPPSLLPGPL